MPGTVQVVDSDVAFVAARFLVGRKIFPVQCAHPSYSLIKSIALCFFALLALDALSCCLISFESSE